MNKGDYAFLIASPEKALCDLIANSSKVILFMWVKRLIQFRHF